MKHFLAVAILFTIGINSIAAVDNDPFKNAEIITPELFGCVGDGVTDDTEGLQKAFDYCLTNNRQLIAHKGKTYAVSMTIMAHTTNDIQIDFGGAVILATKPMEHIIDLDNYDIPERIGHSSVVNNLVLDCNSMSGGVYCPRACKISFNFLMVRNCNLKAFRVVKGYEVFVTNSHIHCTTGPESYGIYMDTGDCHSTRVFSNYRVSISTTRSIPGSPITWKAACSSIWWTVSPTSSNHIATPLRKDMSSMVLLC